MMRREKPFSSAESAKAIMTNSVGKPILISEASLSLGFSCAVFITPADPGSHRATQSGEARSCPRTRAHRVNVSDEVTIIRSYEDFPWFKDVPVAKILVMEEPTPGHFYWPDLDVDLGLETIAHPEGFPLASTER